PDVLVTPETKTHASVRRCPTTSRTSASFAGWTDPSGAGPTPRAGGHCRHRLRVLDPALGDAAARDGRRPLVAPANRPVVGGKQGTAYRGSVLRAQRRQAVGCLLLAVRGDALRLLRWTGSLRRPFIPHRSMPGGRHGDLLSYRTPRA